MHHINGSYTTYINKKYTRSGHLFQGRYKAILVDKDRYLLELSRYIHLNPVRAKIVQRPEDYPYSSYGTYLKGKEDGIVTPDLILSMVSGQGKDAQKRYRERKIAVYLMKRHAGAKNEQIGELFGGISYSGVAKINKRFSKEVDEN